MESWTMQPYHPTIVVTRDESDPWLVTLMQIAHLDTDGWWVPITFGYVDLPINGPQAEELAISGRIGSCWVEEHVLFF